MEYFLLWKFNQNDLSFFLCSRSSGNEFLETTAVREGEDWCSQEKCGCNFIFLHGRESHIFLIRDIKENLHGRELESGFNLQEVLISKDSEELTLVKKDF